MSDGEEKNGGRNNINSLADSMESLIAALFLDGGIEITIKFIQHFWKEDLQKKQ